MTLSPTPRIGVCSWSLRPSSPTDLIDKVRALGLRTVQLALDPLRTSQWPERDTARTLADAGITIASGMLATAGEDYSTLDSIRRTGGLRPDSTWDDNRRAADDIAAIAHRLGLTLVTCHAGFLPHDRRDPERDTLISRLRTVAQAFSSRGIRLGLETGQESADTLLSVLEDIGRADVGVNFDPANMILYNMGDPIAAFRRLAPHVVQVHIKDAIPTTTPGQWGTEVPVGRGGVDWPTFLTDVRRLAPTANLMIEREAGAGRTADILGARELLERHGFAA